MLRMKINDLVSSVRACISEGQTALAISQLQYHYKGKDSHALRRLEKWQEYLNPSVNQSDVKFDRSINYQLLKACDLLSQQKINTSYSLRLTTRISPTPQQQTKLLPSIRLKKSLLGSAIVASISLAVFGLGYIQPEQLSAGQKVKLDAPLAAGIAPELDVANANVSDLEDGLIQEFDMQDASMEFFSDFPLHVQQTSDRMGMPAQALFFKRIRAAVPFYKENRLSIQAVSTWLQIEKKKESHTIFSIFQERGTLIELGMIQEQIVLKVDQQTIYSNQLVTDYVHIICSYTESNFDVFINGNLHMSMPLQNTLNKSPWLWEFGKGSMGNFRGIVDEIRLYNRSLSGSDVLGLFNYEQEAISI